MNRPREAMLQIAAVLALLVANSSAALADCGAEVEVAFQKLQMPGRAYRRETTMASIVHVADTSVLNLTPGTRLGCQWSSS